MANTIQVKKPGTETLLKVPGGKPIPALINQCCLSADGGIQYEVLWFNGQAACKEWVPAVMLEYSDKTEYTQIGFKTYKLEQV